MVYTLYIIVSLCPVSLQQVLKQQYYCVKNDVYSRSRHSDILY